VIGFNYMYLIFWINYTEFFVSDLELAISLNLATQHEGRLEQIMSEMLRQFQAKMEARTKTDHDQMRREMRVGQAETRPAKKT
jgi:hypothetical protein